MEYFADKGREGFSALVSEIRAEAKGQAVTEYWFQHFRQNGLCAVCGNTGIIETHPRASETRMIPCFCPNGQAIRAINQGAD